MSKHIAYQITDDFEMMLDDGEFDSSCEANEWLLEQVQREAKAHVQSLGRDVYVFQDGSVITFKGGAYRVEVARADLKEFRNMVNNLLLDLNQELNYEE